MPVPRNNPGENLSLFSRGKWTRFREGKIEEKRGRSGRGGSVKRGKKDGAQKARKRRLARASRAGPLEEINPPF